MAHFAELDKNNRVLRVIVVNNSDILDENENESEAIGIAFCKDLVGKDTNWVQTSYNGTFRKRYAAIGLKYDVELDEFVGEKIVIDTVTPGIKITPSNDIANTTVNTDRVEVKIAIPTGIPSAAYNYITRVVPPPETNG